MGITAEEAKKIAANEILEQRGQERFANFDLSNESVKAIEYEDHWVFTNLVTKGDDTGAMVCAAIWKDSGNPFSEEEFFSQLLDASKPPTVLSETTFNLRKYI